jgi:protein adenylyltransferase
VRAGQSWVIVPPMNETATAGGLHALTFENRFTAALPADPEPANFCREVRASFSRVAPLKVRAPRCVAYSLEAARLLDLVAADCETPLFAQVLAGNVQLPGMDPHATCYGGHQFGAWAGQLGDGRAINLGDVLNARGEHWTLQLKGAGPTPYSRSADGLAVLRSSIREFLCSEAMFHLGVPTTRALAIVATGETVERDILYDGHPADEPGAVVCRLAPSFIRFGHFEMPAARGDVALLKSLADFTIRTEFADLGVPAQQPQTVYLAWFEEICKRTALLIAHWMRVGFVHGVMNTDNMSVLGLTIDYGPYGWLDNYDPNWTPNTTDAQGRRYRYGYQPAVAQWNLLQLANAIYPLIGAAEPLEALLRDFVASYRNALQTMQAQKLGLRRFEHGDEALWEELDAVLQLGETDMTIFFRRLALLDAVTPDAALLEPLSAAYYAPLAGPARDRTLAWLRSYQRRIRADAADPAARRLQMDQANPKYVLRNYMAQLAIDRATEGDYALVNELLNVLRAPYADQPDNERWAAKRPDWARQRVGCSMLSCSS